MTRRPPLAMPPAPDLTAQDVIILNTSGGKDSQVLVDYMHGLAVEANVTDKLLAVHCDLGRAEWDGTRELAEEQAAHYGIPFVVVSRELGDLLDQIADRRVALDRMGDEAEAEGDMELAAAKRAAPAFPSSDARYCTSDQKTSQVKKLMTALVDGLIADGKLGEPTAYTKKGKAKTYRPARILNCLGIRAAESDRRAGFDPLTRDCASNGKREVTRWYPIFDWSDDEVWARIRKSGVRYHRAYDLGMSRLSCAFCVFASKADLKISARHNRALAEEYVALEELTHSRFTLAHSMAEILAEVDAEDAAGTVIPITARRTRICLEVKAA